jgi:hypothetical protein
MIQILAFVNDEPSRSVPVEHGSLGSLPVVKCLLVDHSLLDFHVLVGVPALVG